MPQPLFPRKAFASKYRPCLFSDLVGQDLTVRLLTHGLVQKALGPAVIFTGTRGVGKTTLARLLARALNCPHRDPTSAEPCGTCEICTSILEDSQLDVIEMDAASHTGVEDIRSLLDACQYKPISCLYKVYIIDEVHMLSKSAFNALLKTLEEPPAHVQFLFATTEVDRVPETILSRCLRLDLRPVETDLLAQYLADIAQKENFRLELGTFPLLARAARGSVRDALSLLERAHYIGHDPLTVADVQALLGLSDEARLETLLAACFQGDIVLTLRLFREMRAEGAAAREILMQILNALHAMTCFRVEATLIEDLVFSETVLARLKTLAQSLSVPALSRLWKLFFQGLEEVDSSPFPELSAEMVLVQASYTAPLPDLYTLLKDKAFSSEEVLFVAKGKGISSFPDVLLALEQHREALLLTQFKQDVCLVSFVPGIIELSRKPSGAQDIPARLAAFLARITGESWRVSWSTQKGEQTISTQEKQEQEEEKKKLLQDP
ncbi:MAG: DNA polymerase III subunit gamma/tau, partial [Holosporales bacterium]|nr:DNA polymerase III subunit gamma/tau [Holosporales bacterium]